MNIKSGDNINIADNVFGGTGGNKNIDVILIIGPGNVLRGGSSARQLRN